MTALTPAGSDGDGPQPDGPQPDGPRPDGPQPDGPEGAVGPDERVGVLLSVDPESVDDVLRASAAAGLEDAEPLTSAGVVTGRISAGAVASLRSLPGVEAVEVERTLRGPPSGAPRR